MKRRDFFRRLRPLEANGRTAADSVLQPGAKAPRSLTDNERFLRAMALGIDPATVTPEHLDILISATEPSTRE